MIKMLIKAHDFTENYTQIWIDNNPDRAEYVNINAKMQHRKNDLYA